MILEARDLGHRFPDGQWGFRNLSFTIRKASFTVLSGHNGSGKTLLARHLVGLEKATEGQIRLGASESGAGEAYSTVAGQGELRRKIGLVFQEPEHQILGATVAEDVGFTLKRRGLAASMGRCEELIERVGLGGKRDFLVGELSGGEKRRLAIAASLVPEPEILVLDEPFNDLDWPGVRTLLSILLELVRNGVSIFLLTHDLEKCLAHADCLLVLEEGRLVADGRPSDIWNRLDELGLRRAPGGPEALATMTWLPDTQR